MSSRAAQICPLCFHERSLASHPHHVDTVRSPTRSSLPHTPSSPSSPSPQSAPGLQSRAAPSMPPIGLAALRLIAYSEPPGGRGCAAARYPVALPDLALHSRVFGPEQVPATVADVFLGSSSVSCEAVTDNTDYSCR